MLALAGCSPKVYSGGYVSENPIKDEVAVGQTKDQVKEKLGSPSSQSSFGDEAWYYISDKQEMLAFFKPEVVQQDVTRIQFDATGLVSKVETYDLKDGEKVAMVSRTTPTEGHTLGFFEQTLGNLGRFNAPSNNSSAPGRRPGT